MYNLYMLCFVMCKYYFIYWICPFTLTPSIWSSYS